MISLLLNYTMLIIVFAQSFLSVLSNRNNLKAISFRVFDQHNNISTNLRNLQHLLKEKSEKERHISIKKMFITNLAESFDYVLNRKKLND